MTSFIPWYIFDAFRLTQSKVSRFKSKFYLFLDTHLVISLYSLSEDVCLISLFFSITRLCEALINTLYSIQLKACEEDPNPKPPCFLTPILLSWSLFDEVPLPYIFFLSPALANLETRFCLRGVVLSHPEIFGFQDVIKIKNKSTIFSEFFPTFIFLHREISIKEN